MGGQIVPDVSAQRTLVWTGNGLTWGGDMHRRVVEIRLVPKTENPEERTDLREPHLDVFVRKHFRELNAKILGAIVAFIQAELPTPETPVTPFHSYAGDWTARVRNLCIWLGLGDPCEGRKRIKVRDEGQEFLRALYAAILNVQARAEKAGTPFAPMGAGSIAALPELKGVFPEALLDRDGRAGSAFGKELVRLAGTDGVLGRVINVDGVPYSLQVKKVLGRPAYFVTPVNP